MSTRETDICVVGAGAAGIWAAERAAREGASVVLLEKTARVGTKILASGGQKCNLTTTLGPREAARLFGEEAERFLRHALRALPPQSVRDRFHELGVPTKTAPLEKVFPESERAVEVRDVLEEAARERGVEIEVEAPVAEIRPRERGWIVEVDGDLRVECAKLLVCPGGRSYPGTGTEGDGYSWMKGLGLSIVEPVPHLVGLTSPEEFVEELAGVDIPAVEARVVDGSGRILERRRRPVLFTHDGVSGPGAMDLARRVTRPRAEGRMGEGGVERFVELDLYPDAGHDALRNALIDAASRPGAVGIASVLPDGPPRSVFEVACRRVGLPAKGAMVDELPAKKRDKLVDTLKRFRVRADGSEGFAHAEVTDGGLALEHVDPRTMHVDEHPGLYVFGELLDVAGPIGGLNFQAAWSEADLAAQSAVSALTAD